MTTLDYATFYETEIRPRQRRRKMLLGAAAVIVWVMPMAWFALAGLG